MPDHSARELIDVLIDAPREVATPWRSRDPIGWPGYLEQLDEVRASTDFDEAAVIVRGRVSGSPAEAVFVVWDFGFMGGSMGTVVGERVARAFEVATDEGLPVVLLPSTGGARMQEGMASLVQMAATAVASRAHAAAGLLQVAVLRHPTTGGVFASHANLADVILAVPDATIGFAGPRVAEAMTGGTLPEGSHTAEGAAAAGLADDVVPIDALRVLLGRLLAWPGSWQPEPVTGGEPGEPEEAGGTRRTDGTGTTEPDATEPGATRAGADDAWAEVQRARADERPKAGSYLERTEVAVELRGDRAGTDDPSVRVVLARIAGRPAVIVGQDRDGDGGRTTAAGYRKAWRGAHLAHRLGVPLVTLIDTPGADASAGAEAGGVAHHIARSFTEVLTVSSPVVSLVIGEGGSGGALCLAVGDRLLIQEHAIFSVIGPEGAAAILHRDDSRAPEVAEQLRLTAEDLRELGIADEVVPEPPHDPVGAGLAAVARALDELVDVPTHDRLDRRARRWRNASRPDPIEQTP
jgi:acyl-CoA carboxylase subunit beta